MSLPAQASPGDTTASAPPLPRWWTAAVLSLLFGTVMFAGAQTMADPDVFWHLKAGDDIWRAKQVLHEDPYSYLTHGQPWVNHEWLAEVIFSRAFAVGGPVGLIALKRVAYVAIAALLCGALRRRGLSLLASALFAALAAALMQPGMGSIRPQMFTYGCFLLLVVALDRASLARESSAGPNDLHDGSPATTGSASRFHIELPLLLLPVLFMLWIGLHGGVVAGLAVLCLWSAAEWVTLTSWPIPIGGSHRRDPPLRTLGMAVIPIVLCVAAMAPNPYGLSLIGFLVRAAAVRPELTEWNPVQIVSFEGVKYVVVLLAVAAGFLWSERPRRLSAVLVTIATALLPLAARRHTPLFAIAAAMFAGPHIVSAAERASAAWRASRLARGAALEPTETRTRSERGRPWIAAAVALEALVLVGLSLRTHGCISIDEAVYPVAAMKVIDQSGMRGPLAVFYDWGGYVLWRRGPELQVSMDPRRETAYSDEVYTRNMAFTFGTGEWDALLSGPANTALVSRNFPTFNLMRLKSDWRLIYEDAISGVFARADSEDASLLSRVGAPPPFGPEDLCLTAY